jgi:hypothetical protein
MTMNPVGQAGNQGRRHWPVHTREMLAGVLFLTLVPTIAHLLISWMGMNPTDDGFFLGMGRRILDGEIPHRDFITARPPGTGIMWAPVILLGGDYTIWISRFFVWFQIACIAWIWTVVIHRMLKQALNPVEQTAMALVAFVGTATTFIITPWPAIDGLWFVSGGLVLWLSNRPFCKFLGYAMIGAACLFKQNFLILGPAFLIVLGDWRQFRYWLAVALPAFAYLAFMWITGALPDFKLQLTSHTEIIKTGFLNYLHSSGMFCGFIVAYFGLLAVSGQIKTPRLNLPRNVRLGLVSVGPAILILPLAFCMVWHLGTTALRYSIILFGMTIGAITYFLCHRDAPVEIIKAAVLVLALMWTVSISIGCNYPVLGTGLAIVLLTSYLRIILTTNAAENHFHFIWRSSLLVGTVITLICFVIGRSWHIYMEQPAWKLTCSLGGVLPGGRLIRTNPVTYEYMKELHDTIEQLQGREYAIIPDAAIYWIKSPQKNPLPTSWPLDFELAGPELFDRFTQALEVRRGRVVILLAKVKGFNLVDKPAPDWYKIVPYVQSHFHKVGETQYWAVYE